MKETKKQVSELTNKLPMWFINKDKYLLAAACNVAFTYEVVAETEKAILIKITNNSKSIHNTWTKWIPKSIIK